ncbi:MULTISPECIES: hypothetical protein [unclassified Sulfitobacter]|uniref:hypothetical protein n=1 Tax=unclassified Sulfitobacter TaxID=196795 RepID=UPI0007C385F8|nr:MULTISPECIES: hypothetical protein [unclassified Sulfitobacter]KZX95402.1 hypothetical protein A3722_18500 [Sulfitobacter sp. HI0027]KZX97973.1 hypothetical protein A3720_17045 [Sulfitobacter sp. HI0021]KZZ03162.1 hypothetical protein A3747_12840 [Sulfitobacter sp. HI0076]
MNKINAERKTSAERDVTLLFLNLKEAAKQEYNPDFIDLMAGEVHSFLAETDESKRVNMVDSVLTVMVDCSGDPDFASSKYGKAIYNLVRLYDCSVENADLNL